VLLPCWKAIQINDSAMMASKPFVMLVDPISLPPSSTHQMIGVDVRTMLKVMIETFRKINYR
jgi:hypothetical protein